MQIPELHLSYLPAQLDKSLHERLATSRNEIVLFESGGESSKVGSGGAWADRREGREEGREMQRTGNANGARYIS